MTELTQGIGRGNIATAAVCEAPSEGVPELGCGAYRLGESIDHCLYYTTTTTNDEVVKHVTDLY